MLLKPSCVLSISSYEETGDLFPILDTLIPAVLKLNIAWNRYLECPSEKRLKTVNLRPMRPRLNLASSLFCKILPIFEDSKLQLGQAKTKDKHFKRIFYFPFFAWRYWCLNLSLSENKIYPQKKKLNFLRQECKKTYQREECASKKSTSSEDVRGSPHGDVWRNWSACGTNHLHLSKCGVLWFHHFHWINHNEDDIPPNK